MKRFVLIGAAGFLAYAAWRYSQGAGQGDSASTDSGSTDNGGTLADMAGTVADAIDSLIPVGYFMWSPDKVPNEFRAIIADTEAANGIPQNLLARLLYQESRYRPEIINGSKRSAAGAIGIAQFMPDTAAGLGIDPADPMQAIPAAGKYLSKLYKSTKSWALALAAYNWGLGNIQRKGIARAPLETQNYYKQILADLGLGVTYA